MYRLHPRRLHPSRLAAQGALKPVIDRTYPLELISEAHAYAEQGHKRGNVILVVSS